MPTNIEIKARASDFNALKVIAEELSDVPATEISQTDTFFVTRQGRLKLRELDSGPAQLIYYERPDLGAPKRSEYHIYETQDPLQLRAVLGLALGVRGTVRKVRCLYVIGQTRVHLDDVDGLGKFLELEVVLSGDQTEAAGRQVAERLLASLGVDSRDLLDKAYIDLLEQAAGSSPPNRPAEPT